MAWFVDRWRNALGIGTMRHQFHAAILEIACGDFMHLLMLDAPRQVIVRDRREDFPDTFS